MPRRAWKPSQAPYPGEASDQTVADAHGVSRDTVVRYRQRHGIAPGGSMGRPTGSGTWAPDPTGLQPGEASDDKVADAHEVDVRTVRAYRRRHGIPTWLSRKRSRFVR